MRSLLGYVARLTRSSARVSPADVVAVLDAGWDEQALHDAVCVCALFEVMNRLVGGLGISADADHSVLSGSGPRRRWVRLKDLMQFSQT